MRAGDGSVGAAVVDVAAALLGTNLNETIRDALTATVPVPEQSALGLTAHIDGVTGGDGAITVKGTVTRSTTTPPPRDRPKR